MFAKKRNENDLKIMQKQTSSLDLFRKNYFEKKIIQKD